MSELISPSRLLLVFVQEPLPGQVKMRLSAEVGEDEATERYKALVAVLMRQLRGLRDCRASSCDAPEDAEDAVRFWILPQLEGIGGGQDGVYSWAFVEGGIDFAPQGTGDLGERMGRQFARGFAEGYAKVAAMGSDCVAMGSGWLNAAFTQLRDEDGVLIGPSTAGGAVLLGLGQMEGSPFRAMRGDTEPRCADMQARAEGAGRVVVQLPALEEINDAESWDRALAGPQGAALAKAMGRDLE